MKKILFLLFALVLLTSCDPNDTPDTKGKFDPNAMILIKPAKGVQLKATVPGLTATEIVEQAYQIRWQSHWFNNEYSDRVKDIVRGLDETWKDFDKPAFKMLADDIIREGVYWRDFPYGFNFVIVNERIEDHSVLGPQHFNDTIAYIPDATIKVARIKIEAAFADGDYNEINRIFKEAFTFLPMPQE